MKTKIVFAPALAVTLAASLVSSAFLAGAADYATTVSGLNPVVYYRLNTTTPMPTEYPATNSGTLNQAVNGQYQLMAQARGLPGAIVNDPGTSVSIWGGAGQQVVIPFSAAYNPSGPFSVEFWARPANVDGGNHTAAISMINGENPSNADDRSGWAIRHAGSDWQFILGFDHSDGETFYHTTLTAAGTAIAEEWQHVVAVYTPEKASIFVNGVEVAGEPPVMPVMPNHAAPLILGDRGYTGWDYNGLLDEFAVYTNALSAEEVLEHYRNGTNTARTVAYNQLILQKNPPLYLRLEEPVLQLPVADNSGSFGAAANGVYMAGTTPGVPGPQMPAVSGFETTNTAAGFNGLSGAVQLPGIDLNTDTVTMVCWLKPDGTQPARAGIMHNRKVSEPQVKATGLGFQDDGRHLSYNWEDRGEAYNFNPGFAPPSGAWTFFAVTVSPENAVMYMGSADGLKSATNNLFHDPHDFSGTTMELGWDNYQATRVFRGALDEFAMFNKALTYNEVKSLFDAALPAILGTSREPADPVYEGMEVAFTGYVAGASPAMQWRKDGAELAGETNASLTLQSVVTNDSGIYELVATSTGKTVSSTLPALAVYSSPPLITQQPAGGTRYTGGAARLSVAVLGSVPMAYQWLLNEVPIPGATTPDLYLSSLIPGNSGDYQVRLTNPYGVTNSSVATITVVAPTNYGAPVMAAGPVAYWRLNETEGTIAADSAGGFDASYVGQVTNGVAGPSLGGISPGNTAYQFNGAGAYLEAPASFDVDRQHFTISLWLKVNAWDKTWQAVITKGDSSWRLHRNGDESLGTTDVIGFGTSGLKNQDLAGVKSLADGQWHHVAAVYDGAMKYIYVDGAVDASAPAWGTVTANDYPVRIGENAQATGRFFNGSIDEVALYNRALAASEIQHLYQKGTSSTIAAPQMVQQPVPETVYAGQPIELSVTAIGGAPYSYQWQRNGTDLTGEVGSSLTIRQSQYSDSGSYSVVVSNAAGTATSQQASVTVLPPPEFANLTNDLVLHLKFDGDYQDSSGRGNNGTAQGEPKIVQGKIGTGALSYSTVMAGDAMTEANYVSLGNPADLQFGTNTDFSIAFWIKFTGSPGDLPFLANNANSMGASGVTLAPSWQEGSWSWGLNDVIEPRDWPGIGLYSPVKNNLNDGNWHHVIHTFDRAGEATTYVDGEAVHSMSIVYATGWDLDTGLDWNIGQAGGVYAVGGEFAMDDLGIWRRALQPDEAEAIYRVGQNAASFDAYGPVSLTAQPTATGLELIWQAGTLESADSLDGTWQPVTGASAPYYPVTVSGNQKFYRVKL